jgi:hypothetical protein
MMKQESKTHPHHDASSSNGSTTDEQLACFVCKILLFEY